MRKIIVTTTISGLTEATEKYSRMDGWDFLLIADIKTPLESYKGIGVEVMTVAEQEALWPRLSDLLGWNCMERKNIGFLEAYSRGYDIIASIDDDNIPLDNWNNTLIVGKEVEVDYYTTDELCFDPLFNTEYNQIWHRGFPLQLLSGRGNAIHSKKRFVFDIQAGLWNGDPDIDAMCRMEHEPNCSWDRMRFPLASNTISPFNTQNTIFSRNAIRKMFMMPGTGRMTDIWASYYCQAHGFNVIYTEATVLHKRHPHDLTKDFNDEITGTLHTVELLKDLEKSPYMISRYLDPRAYMALLEYELQIDIIDAKV